jgi:hypothetical protein
MKAQKFIHRRRPLSENSFLEIVIWLLPKPLPGSAHKYKYRLAFVVDNECALRFDNETGKGDHKHVGNIESSYRFVSIKKLVADFEAEVRRWNNENRNT